MSERPEEALDWLFNMWRSPQPTRSLRAGEIKSYIYHLEAKLAEAKTENEKLQTLATYYRLKYDEEPVWEEPNE